MGSLASRPKTPAVQPVQYVYMPASSYSSSSAAATPASAAPSDDNVQTGARNQNLLERRRGRLGTVLTGFRGLLNDTMGGARKTLLGE